MRTISVSEFKTSCLALLERVRKSGQPTTVTKRGKPVVRVVPIRAADRRKRDILGYMKGTGRIIGDIESPASDPRDWEALRN
jgi:prevent-host-death family protein